MPRSAFRMQLHQGQEAEYKRRHDAIWPELADLLRQSGVRQYSIFLEEVTGSLFGVLETDDAAAMGALPQHPVMQRWGAYMSDVMETNPDHSPVSTPLTEVFYLP